MRILRPFAVIVLLAAAAWPQPLTGRIDDIAIDAQGNIFVAVSDSYLVLKVAPDGDVSVFAGTGERMDYQELGGDGVPAVAAKLRGPTSVTVDPLTNEVYIADSLRVRRVDANGIITTVAGSGDQGDGVAGGELASEFVLGQLLRIEFDPNTGKLYILQENGRIWRVENSRIYHHAGSGEQGCTSEAGPALEAQFPELIDLAVGLDGSVYLADYDRRIHKVDPDGSTITAVAGNWRYWGYPIPDGTPALRTGLRQLLGVTLDSDNRLHFVGGNGFIYRLERDGTLTLFSDGLDLKPKGRMVFNPAGNLILASTRDFRIFEVSADGRQERVIADLESFLASARGSAAAAKAELFEPPHIIGGREVGPGEWPFVVWVNASLNCTGSLVAPNWVLTAAHCLHDDDGIVDDPGNVSVFLGYDWDKGVCENIREEIVRVIVHPDYDDDSKGSIPDAALVEILQAAPAEPVKLLTREEEALYAPAGATATVIGRGHQDDGSLPRILRQADLILWSTEDCRENSLWENWESGVINESALCAGRVEGEKTASGDSGSPYVVPLPGGVWGQVGIHNLGSARSDSVLDYPSVLTRAAAIRDWMNSQITLTEPEPGPGPTTPPPGPPSATVGEITTFAGTGEHGFGGDSGTAVQARLRVPTSVAVDGAGNLFIADKDNHRIRKVDSSGIITTVAGSGVAGFGGDGGSALNAQLAHPWWIAVDGSGNLFIADSGNYRVRKVDLSGVITTVAGSGERGYGGDGGPAVQARLDYPTGIATDGAGNLFIADHNNHRVRKVDPSGIITTVAGTEEGGYGGDGGPAVQARLQNPTGLAVDDDDNLYIADQYTHRIRMVNPYGVITTVAGSGDSGFSGDGGPAVQARLNYPTGVTVDGAGNLFIADKDNHRIRMVDSSGVIATIVGSGEIGFSGDGGSAVLARLRFPIDVAMDGAGNLFIADHRNDRIRAVNIKLPMEPATPPVGPTTPPVGPQPTADGTITTLAGNGESGGGFGSPAGDGGPAVDAQLDQPEGVATDGAGNVFIADTGWRRVRKVDSSRIISAVAGKGSGGRFDGDGGPAVDAEISKAEDVAADGLGNLYIADTENSRIRMVDSSGTISTIVGPRSVVRTSSGFRGDGGPATEARLFRPLGVAVDSSGNLYIADTQNHRIRKVDSSGIITTIAGSGSTGFGNGGFSGDGGLAVDARLYAPSDVAVDGEGNLYIADLANNRIRKVDASGIITTIAGNGPVGDFGSYGGDGGPATQGQLNYPYSVAVDSGGNLYIADRRNHRVRQVDSSGTITTIAGTGEYGFGGDGGPAVLARLNFPSGLALDTDGNLYIADRDNNRIRVLKTNPLLTGDQIYYFPHLAVGAGWQTTLTLINYSAEEVTCRTDFLSDQGTPLMVSFPSLGPDVRRIDVLPPGGSVHEETDVGLNAALAAGWARASCTGPVKASLLFRQYDSAGVPLAEAGVNAATAPATRFVTFAERAPGQLGTGVAYANPSDTTAVVTFTARDEAGRMLPSVNQTLMPNGHGAQNMAGLFTSSSFTGSLEIISTEPIVSLSLNAEAPPIFSSLPPGEPDAAAQGPTTYYFPHLAVGASWQTTLTYINDSAQEVTCETKFISDHGGPLLVSFPGQGTVMERTDVLPPGGSVHEETDVDLGSMLVPGWAKAACTGPVKASLLFRQYDSEGNPVAEAGVNAASVPATRFVTFAEQAEGKTGTGVAYANPSETAAHVTFTAKDTEGQTLASVVRTVLADGHDAQVMSALFGFTSFNGSLEVTSTVPIVSLSLNFEAAPVFSSLPPGEVEESAP